MKSRQIQKVDTSKTPQEKAQLSTEKARWRKKCQTHYKDWTKRTAAKLFDGKRKMNPNFN